MPAKRIQRFWFQMLAAVTQNDGNVCWADDLDKGHGSAGRGSQLFQIISEVDRGHHPSFAIGVARMKTYDMGMSRRGLSTLGRELEMTSGMSVWARHASHRTSGAMIAFRA